MHSVSFIASADWSLDVVLGTLLFPARVSLFCGFVHR